METYYRFVFVICLTFLTLIVIRRYAAQRVTIYTNFKQFYKCKLVFWICYCSYKQSPSKCIPQMKININFLYIFIQMGYKPMSEFLICLYACYKMFIWPLYVLEIKFKQFLKTRANGEHHRGVCETDQHLHKEKLKR